MIVLQFKKKSDCLTIAMVPEICFGNINCNRRSSKITDCDFKLYTFENILKSLLTL